MIRDKTEKETFGDPDVCDRREMLMLYRRRALEDELPGVVDNGNEGKEGKQTKKKG